jgi:hypothetical protein
VRGSSDFVFAVAHTSEFHATSQNHNPPTPNFIGRPERYVVGQWYYSEACLEGLTEIQLCINQSKCNRPCIGMLLKYSDGHLRSLGQWRSDLTHAIVKPTKHFHIGTALFGHKSYVRHVGLSKSVSSRPEEVWYYVSVHDTLSWWFNSEQTEIFVRKQSAA